MSTEDEEDIHADAMDYLRPPSLGSRLMRFVKRNRLFSIVFVVYLGVTGITAALYLPDDPMVVVCAALGGLATLPIAALRLVRRTGGHDSPYLD